MLVCDHTRLDYVHYLHYLGRCNLTSVCSRVPACPERPNTTPDTAETAQLRPDMPSSQPCLSVSNKMLIKTTRHCQTIARTHDMNTHTL